MLDRARIEAMAEDFGFTLVRPERLTVPEQIALFGGAGVIAGEYGSALHNSVFSAPGTAICALRGNARHPSLVQSGIGTAMGQETGYVFGRAEGTGAAQAFHIEPRHFGLAMALLRMREEGRAGEAHSPARRAAPPSRNRIRAMACAGT